MNIATATPAEIDAALALLDGKLTSAFNEAVGYRKSLDRRPTDIYYAERLEAAHAKVAKIQQEMKPLNDEFSARGGWTRAFVVADGHVHSSMHCSTCNNGQYMTSFGWVTEFSGKTEAEVIEAAGSRACTVCYPNAPVDAPAGRIFHKDEVAAQAAREERVAKKAAADAKKAANAFGPYRAKRDLIETVYAAKGFLTDAAEWKTINGQEHPSFPQADVDAVAALLGEKLGTTAQAQIEAAAKRAANR